MHTHFCIGDRGDRLEWCDRQVLDHHSSRGTSFLSCFTPLHPPRSNPAIVTRHTDGGHTVYVNQGKIFTLLGEVFGNSANMGFSATQIELELLQGSILEKQGFILAGDSA